MRGIEGKRVKSGWYDRGRPPRTDDGNLHATLMLDANEIVAVLSDGRSLRSEDALVLAKLLLAAGLNHDDLYMLDWREGDRALTSGQKTAIKWQMHRGRSHDELPLDLPEPDRP